MRCRPTPIALLAAAAFAVAGCGTDDDEPGRTATVPAEGIIEVVGDEYSFDPETLIVTGAAGREITIALKNDGVLAHNLKVIRDGDDLGGTPTFQGGKTREGKITLEAGTYEMVCTVGNHADLGMVGTLEIRE